MGSMGMALTQGSPFWMFMKPLIYDIREFGVLDILQQKWNFKKQNCAPLESSGEPLSFQKLLSLFLISLFGIILTLIILFIEIIFKKWCYKSNALTQHPTDTAELLLKNNLQELLNVLQKRNMGNQVLHSMIQDLQKKIQL